MRKETKLARLFVRTSMCLGRYTFLTREALPAMLPVDCIVPIEKKRHGRSAARTNTGKFWMPDLRRKEKTRVSMTIIDSGFKRDHRKPSAEFLYLILKSFLTRIQMSSRLSNMLVHARPNPVKTPFDR